MFNHKFRASSDFNAIYNDISRSSSKPNVVFKRVKALSATSNEQMIMKHALLLEVVNKIIASSASSLSFEDMQQFLDSMDESSMVENLSTMKYIASRSINESLSNVNSEDIVEQVTLMDNPSLPQCIGMADILENSIQSYYFFFGLMVG